jgi:hypothetical protein
MGQGAGKFAESGHPADPGQILPMLLFLDFSLFAFGDVPVAGPDADEFTLIVGHGLADMFNPTDGAVWPLHAKLAFPGSRLFQGITVMGIPEVPILRHDYFPEEIRAFF